MIPSVFSSIAKSVSFSPFSRKKSALGKSLVPYAFSQQRRASPSEVHQITIGYDKSPSTYVCSAAEEIEMGSRKCVQQICEHPMLRRSTEFAVFGFGEMSPAKCYCDFTPAEAFEMPKLPRSMGTWIDDLFIEMIEANLKRMELHSKDCDQDVRSAWMFYFSDFCDTGMPRLDEALRLREQATENNINIFLIGAGEHFDERCAVELSQPGRPPVHMKSVKDFLAFFEWLFRSLRQKSMSVPGVPLQLEDLFGETMKGDG